MSVLGKWRIAEMPDYDDDFPDMIEPACILFELHAADQEAKFIARSSTSSTAC